MIIIKFIYNSVSIPPRVTPYQFTSQCVTPLHFSLLSSSLHFTPFQLCPISYLLNSTNPSFNLLHVIPSDIIDTTTTSFTIGLLDSTTCSLQLTTCECVYWLTTMSAVTRWMLKHTLSHAHPLSLSHSRSFSYFLSHPFMYYASLRYLFTHTHTHTYTHRQWSCNRTCNGMMHSLKENTNTHVHTYIHT